MRDSGRPVRRFTMRSPFSFSTTLVLALIAAGPCWAAKDIPPDPALQRSESFLAQAQKEGAPELAPALWLAAVEKLNAAYAAYHHQVEEKADSPKDKEAIAARWLAEEAEVDTELVLVTARAVKDERRNPRSGRRRSTP